MSNYEEIDDFETMIYDSQYAVGMRDGEQDGALAYYNNDDCIAPYNPDRTPYQDGYDDGFVSGYHIARQDDPDKSDI